MLKFLILLSDPASTECTLPSYQILAAPDPSVVVIEPPIRDGITGALALIARGQSR